MAGDITPSELEGLDAAIGAVSAQIIALQASLEDSLLDIPPPVPVQAIDEDAGLTPPAAEKSFERLADVNVNGISDGDVLRWNAISSNWLPLTGATGTFTTTDLKTVTVANGIITTIV